MGSSRRVPSAPGLARLLADASGERRAILARVWGGDPDDTGFAALYRRMTDAQVARRLLENLSPSARVVLSHLAREGRPLDATAIAAGLRLAGSEVEAAIAEIEEPGLLWRTPPDREGSARWFVPGDLARALRPARRTAQSAEPPGAGLASPRPRPPPTDLLPGGQLPRLVSDWRLARDVPRARRIRALADHCALVLGVWERDRREVKPGPRHATWEEIDDPARIEALARLWVVDDDSPEAIPETARDALWNALQPTDPHVWYDLGEIARSAARLAGADRPTRWALARPDLERGVGVLRWIGVVRVGRDQTDRLRDARIIQVTEVGARILRQRYVGRMEKE